MANTASSMVRLAATQIGVREGQDPDGNWNNLQKYGAWYGWNGVAWCGQFISWLAANTSNTDIIPKYQWCPSGLEWFRSRDLTGHWPPAPGDILFVRKFYDGAWHTPHTGLVEKYLGDGRVQTIEGNTNDSGAYQGNGVYRLVRQDSESGTGYIYARPKYLPEPPPVVIIGGGQTAPINTFVAPPPYILPTSQRTITVANVRPGRRNESVRRFNALLWASMSQSYRNVHYKAWMGEAANYYGPVAQQACYDKYKQLVATEPKGGWFLPTKPAWPGAALVRRLGGKPV